MKLVTNSMQATLVLLAHISSTPPIIPSLLINLAAFPKSEIPDPPVGKAAVGRVGARLAVSKSSGCQMLRYDDETDLAIGIRTRMLAAATQPAHPWQQHHPS